MDASERYDSLFQFYGDAHGVDWKLLKAQAHVESGLDPAAVSPAGAQGIAQFMPATWYEWGLGSPLNVEHSVRAQARYMQYLLRKCEGDTRKALAAYNWGLRRVLEIGDQSAPRETREYVQKVMEIYGG